MSNYAKGYRFERKLKKMYEERGYYVTRSSGSHGVDLVAVNMFLEPKVVFINCTTKGKTRKEIEEFLSLCRKFGATPAYATRVKRKTVVTEGKV
ncbi:MAG: restriction endonuclease [Thermoproteota archaeon]